LLLVKRNPFWWNWVFASQIITKIFSWEVSIPALYLWGPTLKSQPENGYPDWGCFSFMWFSSISRKILGQDHRLGHDCFLPHPFQFPNIKQEYYPAVTFGGLKVYLKHSRMPPWNILLSLAWLQRQNWSAEHRKLSDYWDYGLFPLSGILENMMFRKLDLFPSSGEGGEKTPTQLGP
jgi:hypothetical protein